MNGVGEVVLVTCFFLKHKKIRSKWLLVVSRGANCGCWCFGKGCVDEGVVSCDDSVKVGESMRFLCKFYIGSGRLGQKMILDDLNRCTVLLRLGNDRSSENAWLAWFEYMDYFEYDEARLFLA